MTGPRRTPARSAATTSEVIAATLRSRAFNEIAAMLPEQTDLGAPRELPGWSVLLLGVLARHYRSSIRAEAELHSDLVWRYVTTEAERITAEGLHIDPAPRPPTRGAWRRARDHHWATDEGLVRIREIHLRHATDLAHALGLADPDGPGSWSHPHRTRAVYGDGTLIRPLYRPPDAVQVTDPDGTTRILYPDPATGELHETPQHRYDPDTAEHHGRTGPVHGTNYVSWHLRGPDYFQRVILTIGNAPAPGTEADTAVALLTDVRRHLGDGIQVVVYDGAMRGTHIDTIMRRDGYVVLAKNASDTDTAHTPTWLRLPGGRAARSYPLGAWEHDPPRRKGCTHLLATMAGAPVEIALDEAGDPTLVGELIRRQVKRPRGKDGRYRFHIAYEVPCLRGNFLVWLSPHTQRGDPTGHRPEHLRILTTGDPDGKRLHGIRSDVEAHHDLLKQTLRNSRAMSLGAHRGLLDLYCFALSHNALVDHRRRVEVPDGTPTWTEAVGAAGPVGVGGRRRT